MPYATHQAAVYGTHITPHTARRVWAAVTAHPQMSLRELADELDLGHGTVGAALRMLKDAGYVDFESGRTGRRVLVPFIIIGKET